MRADRLDKAWHSKSPVDSNRKQSSSCCKDKTQSQKKCKLDLVHCLFLHSAGPRSVKFTRGIRVFAISKYDVEGTAERVVCEVVIKASVYTCEAAEVDKFNF